MATPSRSEQNQALAAKRFYQLCIKSPENGLCDGLKLSQIPLEDRPGTRVRCWLTLDQFQSNDCRVSLTEEKLVVYLERQTNITEEIEIPLSNIFTKDLRFWKRGRDSLNVIVRTLRYNLQELDAQEYSKILGEYDPNKKNARAKFSSNGPFSFKTTKDLTELDISFFSAPQAGDANRSNVLQIMADEQFGVHLNETIKAPLLTASTAAFTEPLRSQNSESQKSEAQTRSTQNRQTLLETGQCVRCDLRGVDLKGETLEGVNLEGANLQNADLAGVNLQNSYLVGADLRGVNLTKANLSGSRLTGASLGGSKLIGAKLNSTFIQRASLQRADLESANLEGATLEGTNLEGANLSKADLSDGTASRYLPFAGVRKFNRYTIIKRANLSGANLTQALLEDARFNESNLTKANFTDVEFNDTHFRGADLSGAVLEDMPAKGMELCNTTLPDGSISNDACPETK